MEDRLTLSDKLEFELQTDILTLLENVKCQSGNSPVLKQALCALATICNTSSNAQDYFRTVGGVELLKDMLLNGDYSDPVISTTFFCLACAVNRNVASQNLLLTENLLLRIHLLFAKEDSDSNIVKTAAFLLANIIDGNGKGQWLAYDTECLTDLINIMKNLLAVKYNEDDQWAIISRAIEVCVNNPQNVTNQQVCCSLIPHILKFITTNPDHKSLHHVLSLFCLVVANNALNQERIYQCGGVDTLVNSLKLQRNGSDQTQSNNLVTFTVAALDACISDNEKACKLAADMGVITLLLELLYDREHEQNYPLIVMLTLGHILEFAKEYCPLVNQGQGYHLLVSYLAETQDDELFKAIKYVFSLCKTEEKHDSGNVPDSCMNKKKKVPDNFKSKCETFSKQKKINSSASTLDNVAGQVREIFNAHVKAAARASDLLENSDEDFPTAQHQPCAKTLECTKCHSVKASHKCARPFKLPFSDKSTACNIIHKSHDCNRARNFDKVSCSSCGRNKTEQSKHLQPWPSRLEVKEKLSKPNCGSVYPNCAHGCDLVQEDLNSTNHRGTSLSSGESLCRKAKGTRQDHLKENSDVQGKITSKSGRHSWPQTVPLPGKEKDNICINCRHGDEQSKILNDECEGGLLCQSNCAAEKVGDHRSISEGQTFVEHAAEDIEIENVTQDRLIADIVQKMTTTLFKSLADVFQPPSMCQQTTDAGLKDHHEEDELMDSQWQPSKVSSVLSPRIGSQGCLKDATHDISAYDNNHGWISMLNSYCDERTSKLQGNKGNHTAAPESITSGTMSPTNDCDALRQSSTIKLIPQLKSNPAEKKEIFVKPKQPISSFQTVSKRTLPNVRISHKCKDFVAEEEETASCNSPPSPALSDFDRFLWNKAKKSESVSVIELIPHMSGYTTTSENGHLKIVMDPSTCDVHSEKSMMNPANFTTRKITVSLKETKGDNSQKDHDVYSFVSDSTTRSDRSRSQNISTKERKRRLRVPYSDEEVRNLLTGVSKMGKSWKQILCSYNFHPARTSIDLKDKYKGLKADLRRKNDR